MGRDHRQNGCCSWAVAAQKLRESDLDFDLFLLSPPGEAGGKIRMVEVLQKIKREDGDSSDAVFHFEQMLLKMGHFLLHTLKQKPN